eukprot:TRINITY_DN747_c0_g1_i16.p1 TRINITY_DN747_c0_g1~~TRINITY_DN747_c0_g1_i16.p1  ORF type:complete len:115 (+),score=38.22 TRINITY_DN747_c0_g1_i16:160-504(+)
MRGFGFTKNALRIKVFKNSSVSFDYQSPSSEEILPVGNEVRGGTTKTLYKIGKDEVVLLEANEDVPEGAEKLCTVVNECSAGNSEGKWKVLVDSKSSPAGLAVPPNEVLARITI